jgi:AcrR family transcriptional regulator
MTSKTKEAILNAAEGLFARHGFADTSLRHITAEAGVNLASVSYHFGSKEALIEAVFARRLVPMNRERMRRLERVEQCYSGREMPLEPLVEAFVAPALELSRDEERGGAPFVRMLGRSYTEPSDSLQESVRGMYEEVIARFKTAFARALPGLAGDELYWRLHFMVGTLAYCMAGTDMMRLIASCRLYDPLDTDILTRRLVAFLSAGLRAVAPEAVDRKAALPWPGV